MPLSEQNRGILQVFRQELLAEEQAKNEAKEAEQVTALNTSMMAVCEQFLNHPTTIISRQYGLDARRSLPIKVQMSDTEAPGVDSIFEAELQVHLQQRRPETPRTINVTIAVRRLGGFLPQSLVLSDHSPAPDSQKLPEMQWWQNNAIPLIQQSLPIQESIPAQ